MAKLNLKQHPDENWWDKITLQSVLFGIKAPHLLIHQNERYKTSGMSGDEWRFSWRYGIYVGNDGNEDWCNGADFSIHAAVAMFSLYPFLDTPAKEKGIVKSPYKAVFYSRERELVSRKYTTLLEGLLTLGKDVVIIPESEFNLFDKRDEITQKCCSQPGCPNKPVSV